MTWGWAGRKSREMNSEALLQEISKHVPTKIENQFSNFQPASPQIISGRPLSMFQMPPYSILHLDVCQKIKIALPNGSLYFIPVLEWQYMEFALPEFCSCRKAPLSNLRWPCTGISSIYFFAVVLRAKTNSNHHEKALE